MMKLRRLFLLFGLVCLAVPAMWAQEKEYMYEVGVGGGAGWLYGDMNRQSVVYDPSAALSMQFRYNLDLRWSIAADLSTMGLKADSRDFDNVFPAGAHYVVDRRCWQLGVRPEFTFWNYGWGADYREKHRLAPFLTAGFAAGLVADKHDSSKSDFYVSVPLGIGVKWKMAPRWDMQLTAVWSKTMTDRLDGIDDPYQVGTVIPVNTDWMGTVQISVSYSFRERCIECHNQSN